jgi:hypothetical protein
MPLLEQFPRNITPSFSGDFLSELGLGGLDSLNRFLSEASSCGIVGAMSNIERKISFLKVRKKERGE